MAKIHHLFVIDPIENLNLKLDSSLRVARALCNIGHLAYICTPGQLEWLSRESCAAAFAQELAFPDGTINSMRLSPARRLRLDFFQAIHMRKDPPYDMNYIASTWLLDSAVARGVKVYNAPAALRNLNEKLSIFKYPDAIRDGLVSADPQQLLHFLKESSNGDAVLKPLTLYGGHGVLRLNLNQQKEEQILHILREETQDGQDLRLMQAFDQRIFEGELRTFCVNGKALSWCLKKPQGDNFLANTRSGATLESYHPHLDEVAMVEKVAQSLLDEGVYFVGFDIIGNFISEINITSPRLLHGPDDTRDYYKEIATAIDLDLG
jgi:glutathione synthase